MWRHFLVGLEHHQFASLFETITTFFVVCVVSWSILITNSNIGYVQYMPKKWNMPQPKRTTPLLKFSTIANISGAKYDWDLGSGDCMVQSHWEGLLQMSGCDYKEDSNRGPCIRNLQQISLPCQFLLRIWSRVAWSQLQNDLHRQIIHQVPYNSHRTADEWVRSVNVSENNDIASNLNFLAKQVVQRSGRFWT